MSEKMVSNEILHSRSSRFVLQLKLLNQDLNDVVFYDEKSLK